MIKKFEFRLNDITSEPFIYDTEEEDWEHEMEQDSLYPKPVNKEVFKVLQRHVKKLKSI